MATNRRVPEPVESAIESIRRALAPVLEPIQRAHDVIRASPANVILTIGIVVFVLGALVLRTGVWAAVLGVWGIALATLGAAIRLAVWWARR